MLFVCVCDVEIAYDAVEKVSVKDTTGGFEIRTLQGNVHNSEAVIVATGAQARWLHKKNEDVFRGV